MANSYFNFEKSESSGSYIEGKIVWRSVTNEDANTSDVAADLYVRKGNTDMTLTIPTEGTWTYVLIIGGDRSTGTVSKSVLTSWVLIASKTVRGISHNTDGTGSVIISGIVDGPSGTSLAGHTTSGGFRAKLDTIPRETTIDHLSCSTQNFNGELTYKYTPQSSKYYTRCNIALNLGSSEYAVKTIDLGLKEAKQQTQTLSLSASELSTIYHKLTNTPKGTLRFTFRTYSDSGYSKAIGDANYKEITLYIPNISDTQPTATMSVTPVSILEAPFNALYIEGRSKVNVNFTGGAGKYGASVVSYGVSVGGVSHDSPYTSGYLSVGNVTVLGTVTDSRGYSRVYTKEITVIPYDRPKILPTSDESEVVCARCDEDGNISESGTYLKIKAKRHYSKVVSDVQNNFCAIRYRYKADKGTSYSDWATVLASDAASDEVDTGALPDVILSLQSSYVVQVQAIDDIGEYGQTTITIPSEEIYLHKAGSIGSLGIGEYAEDEDTISIAKKKRVRLKSDINGVRMYAKDLFDKISFDINTTFSDFSGTGDERQNFFVFGDVIGSAVHGIARVTNNGATLWSGTDGVKLTAKSGGILSIELPTKARDVFIIISGKDFTI